MRLVVAAAAALCACLACTDLPEEETVGLSTLWIRDSLAVRAILDVNGRGDLNVGDIIGIEDVDGERRVTGLWLQHVSAALVLPPVLGDLQALRVLVLDTCGLTSLPGHICGLRSLRELYLKGNDIQSLPADIGLLDNLMVLEAPDNHIDRLPPELAGAEKLSALILHHNLLADFPAELVAHPVLRNQGADMAFNKLCNPLGPAKEDWLTMRDPNWRTTQQCP